jgi:hypothetical protein
MCPHERCGQSPSGRHGRRGIRAGQTTGVPLEPAGDRRVGELTAPRPALCVAIGPARLGVPAFGAGKPDVTGSQWVLLRHRHAGYGGDDGEDQGAERGPMREARCDRWHGNLRQNRRQRGPVESSRRQAARSEGPENANGHGNPWPFAVEARGFEPRSENGSNPASTCIGCAWGLRRQGRSRPTVGQAPEVSLGVTEQHAEPARYCDTLGPPQAGLRSKAGAVSRSLRSQGQVSIGSCVVSQQDLSGCRAPEHATRSSPNPSKPVAPGLSEICSQIYTRSA